MDPIARLGPFKVRVNARAAEADERLHLVLAGGVGEASEGGAVSRAACHGCVLSAPDGHGLVVDAFESVLRRGLRHVLCNQLQLGCVGLSDVLVKLALCA